MPRRRTLAPSLTELFHPIVQAALEDLDLGDAAVADYLTGLLTRCALSEELWALASGARLDGVADHLAAIRARRAGDAPDDVVASARLEQQLGDHALFMSGMFWERVRGSSMRRYYAATGQRAYRAAAAHEAPDEARLLYRLADRFDRYAGALAYLREVYLDVDFGPAPAGSRARMVVDWR
jgi:hypothetical protein